MPTPGPHRCLFPSQGDDEEVFLVVRQHWVVLIKQLIIWLLFAFLPVFFDFLAIPAFGNDMGENASSIIGTIKGVYLMLLLGALFTIWTLYYLNFQVVTNERVVDMVQKSVLNHVTSELNLRKIQDVTAEVKGILATFFDYGNVYIQTAGETERFQFDNVPHPHKVAKLVLELYEHLPSVDSGEKGDT